MNKEVIIRKIFAEDLDKIYEIEQECFENPYPLSFLHVLYTVNKDTFLVADNVGQIVGYVIAADGRNLGNIVSIAVIHSKRWKGIGSNLMREILRILASKGTKTVRLEVRKSNINAHRFYELLDFKRSHIIDKYYGNEDAVVYLKQM